MSEQFPSQPQNQAPDQDPYSGGVAEPRFPMPSESIGAPRPPRQYRRGLRDWLWVVLGLAVASLYIWSATRWLVILLYAGMTFVYFIRFIFFRFIVRRPIRRARPRPRSPKG
jgi:hypothetical protein